MATRGPLLTPAHAATGRTGLALTIAAAALLPLWLALHYAFQTPPSRSMAALNLAHQSGEDSQTARVRHNVFPSPGAPARVA